MNYFRKSRVVVLLVAILLPWAMSFAGELSAHDVKPNVLLIILEDWGPYLGCYGQKFMHTPNLDQLAAEGCRYDACFSSAPVCSTGRSSLMTGMSQYSVHSEQHRTADKKPLPPGVKSLPEMFRDAGYFTALGCGYSAKIDLNFQFPAAKIYLGNDWKQRKPGQPFFAHLTLIGTHRPWRSDPARPIDPALIVLPPWYPDTPLTRKDWAMGLESAQDSDRLMGEIVARLKREGIYDNTAIVITADHGVALPRGQAVPLRRGAAHPADHPLAGRREARHVERGTGFERGHRAHGAGHCRSARAQVSARPQYPRSRLAAAEADLRRPRQDGFHPRCHAGRALQGLQIHPQPDARAALLPVQW